jgi:hypothetical protein
MKRSSLLVVALVMGCQTYDFMPVEPQVIGVVPREFPIEPVLRPNLMLAVDRSGSMGRTTSTDAACSQCGSGVCPASCPTRMSDLRQAVTTFTQLSAEKLRLGLTVFPEETSEIGAEASCRAPTSVRVPFPPESRADDAAADVANRAAASQVNAEVQRLAPGGGTPTGAALTFLGNQRGLTQQDFRGDYVVLLTDGLPNCNPSNPNDYETNPAMCRCQSGSGDCSGTEIRRRGCLDADGTVAQVEALAARGVKTIVIGFGADTSQADAQAVLSRMAAAGGFGPALQAANRVELERVLMQVLADVVPLACRYDLTAVPIVDGAVSVLIDDQRVPGGDSTWTVRGRELILERAFCEANFGKTLKVRVATSP